MEMTPEMFSDSMSEVTAKEKELVTALKAMLGIYAESNSCKSENNYKK